MIRRFALAVALTATALVFAPTRNADAAPLLVVPSSFMAGLQRTFGHPDISPPGANKWDCKPTAAHPRPVVLVHGTAGSMSSNMGYLSKNLRLRGYCVYALNYGGPPAFGYLYGLGPVADSAMQLKKFIEEEVLPATGASQVDIVGHSQGGMMPRWYMKFLGGASKVHTLVGLSPSNHGTGSSGPTRPEGGSPFDMYEAQYCQACIDQGAGSEFMKELNEGGDTLPGVDYTVIETMYDVVVTPYQSAFLTGPNVHNITLQDVCPLDFSEHLGTAFDPIAMRLILNAFDPSHAVAPECRLVLSTFSV